MTTSKRVALILLWALSLIIVAAFAHAQTVQRPATPTVLSGSDVGFRVQGREGNHVLGTFVVRINGEWIEAEPPGNVRKLTSQVR
jgi:hypothetical protein